MVMKVRNIMTKDINNIADQIKILYTRALSNPKLNVRLTVKWVFKGNTPIFTTIAHAQKNEPEKTFKNDQGKVKDRMTMLGLLRQHLDKNELVFIPIANKELTDSRIDISANRIATLIVNKLVKEKN